MSTTIPLAIRAELVQTQQAGPARGQLANVVAEITQLHAQILAAARTALDKAIRLGELLTSIKGALKHGEWLTSQFWTALTRISSTFPARI